MRYSAKGRIKMTWKKILKMPVPLDTDTNRDTDYTAAITQYEKDIIEPVLEGYTVDDNPSDFLLLITKQ